MHFFYLYPTFLYSPDVLRTIFISDAKHGGERQSNILPQGAASGDLRK
jgi:hypothetical protein